MISFSIVTPSFNQGTFIERTIRSVLEQDYPELEYVIRDACSADETPLVLQRYTHSIRVISEPDKGQADAVNKGIRATNGDVIGWLNSDDTYQPGTLFTVAAYLSRHPDIDVVYGDANLIDSDDRIIGRYYTESWNPRQLPRRPFLCQPAVFFRRRVVENYGLLDADLNYTLDYEYWLRLASHGVSFAYVPYTLANSRLHSATKTHGWDMRAYAELNNMLKRYVMNVPEGWILTQTQAVLREAHKTPFRNPLEFAAAVALVSWRLSLEINHSVSPKLVVSTMRTLTTGAVKTALGRPVSIPTE